jgi:hypothetical protein
MKNAFDGLISRLETTKVRISELENMSVGIFCNELQRETKRMRNQIGHLKTMV